jgi:hypothetical protein
VESEDKLFLGLVISFAVVTMFCVLVGSNFKLKTYAAQNHLMEKCLQTPRTVQECKELTK